MADIEVTLGAKNEASKVLREFQSEIGSTAQAVEFSFRGLAQLAGTTAAVAAIVESGRSLFDFAKQSMLAFDETNKTAIRLKETLDIIPGSVAGTSEEIRKLADSLERVTNVSASKIIDAATGALRRGADPKQLDEVTEAAVGLSRVFDRDLQSSMRLVEEATKGNFDAFTGLIPGIKSLSTEEEKLAAVSRLAQTGLENKAKSAREAVESTDALRVAMSQLYRTVGELLAPIRDVVYKGLILISDFIIGQINPDLETFEETIKRITEAVNGIAEYMATGFIGAFTAAETVVLNFSDSIGVAVDYVSLRITTMIEDVKYGFSSLFGQIQTLAANVPDLLFLALNELVRPITIQTDEHEKIIKDVRERLSEALSVPDRQITQAEKALRDSINDRLENLFSQYTQKFNERVQSLSKEVKIPFKVELERAGGLQPERPADLLRDLQAFESRIMTRGPAQSPVDKMVENTKKIADNTEKMLEKQQGTTDAILGVNVSPGDARFVEIR